MKRLIAAAVLLALTLTLHGCSTEPSCDDVSALNSKVQDIGQQDLDEGTMNDYVDAQQDLAAAEDDCSEKGEAPRY